MNNEQSYTSPLITRGKEQPSLEYGPQRLHYIYSVGIPQAYLTLFSILQGFVFSVVLASIPVPKDTQLPLIWDFTIQKFFYLPYIISLSILILIWLHLISVTLASNWPHTFFQILLIVGLALFETVAIQNIKTLSIWLTFLGCTSVLGGTILIRTGRLRHADDFDPHPAFQKYGEVLKKWEAEKGKQYIIIGVLLITITIIRYILLYTFNLYSSFFHIIFPWLIYIFIIAILYCMIVSRIIRNKSYRETQGVMYHSTDLIISRGVARYNKNSPTFPETTSFKEDNSKIHNKAASRNLLTVLVSSNVLIILYILQKVFLKGEDCQ